MSLRYMFNLLRPRVTTSLCVRLKTTEPEKRVVIYDPFNKVERKDKSTYIQMIKIFIENDTRRRGHVEFIYAALGYLKEFGVNKDLEVYKALLEVLPKGRFIPTNIFQAEFMHFPKQQQCAVDLLEMMEDNGVMPDFEMQDILLTVFGDRGIPLRKFWRMMYWMPKFRNLSPWYLPQTLPADALELARLALMRITSVDNDTKISLFQTEEVEASLDNTWVLSAQSPTQIALLAAEAKRRVELKEKKVANDTDVANMKKKEAEKQASKRKEDLDDDTGRNTQYKIPEDKRVKSPDELKLEKSLGELEPLTVHGPYKVHLRDQRVSYFVLTGPVINRPRDPRDKDDVSSLKIPPPYGSPSPPVLLPNVHEQDDGTVLAICATGSSSRDSLLSWIRLLEKNGNPDLGDLGVVFTLVAPPSELAINITDVTAE